MISIRASLRGGYPGAFVAPVVGARLINTGRTGGTYHYQKSMPRLPIPKLDESLTRYLAAVQPILSAEEFGVTRNVVQEFGQPGGIGLSLHDELVARDKANPETSFITPFWDDMYLRSRASVMINSNPFMSLNDDPRIASHGGIAQVKRAAQLLHSSLRFHKALVGQSLDPDVYHMGTATQQPWFKSLVQFVPQSISYYAAYFLKGYPLDMRQYKKLFGTSRIPHPERDIVQTTSNSKHIIVLRDGLIYPLQVLNDDGKYLSRVEVERALNSIVADANERSARLKSTPSADETLARKIPFFTGTDRTFWAHSRASIAKVPANERNLSVVDSALFALSLDSFAPNTREGYSRLFLHGIGGANRWFDKSFSLVVCPNAKAGVSFEHSWGDGVSVLRYMNEIYADSLAEQMVAGEQGTASGTFAPLNWEMTDDIRSRIQAADDSVTKAVGRLDVVLDQFPVFGKDYLKQKNISPDGVAQMAIQLGYFKKYGKTVATYESASTAGFRAGRTETIRPATMDAVKFVKAMTTPTASAAERNAALRAAAVTQKKLTVEAAIGKGFDRHLFALLNIAKERTQQSKLDGIPAVFADEGYRRINHNILSTSTLMSEALEMGGFGPVVEDGFGLGYGLTDDSIGFHVTSFGLDTRGFVEALEDSAKDIRAVLEAVPTAKPAAGKAPSH